MYVDYFGDDTLYVLVSGVGWVNLLKTYCFVVGFLRGEFFHPNMVLMYYRT